MNRIFTFFCARISLLFLIIILSPVFTFAQDLDADNDGITDAEEQGSCTSGVVLYEFYDGTPSGNTVDNIPTSGALATGVISDFDVNALQNALDPGDTNSFGIRYTGTLTIATAGTYTFYTTSDDGSKLFINGTEVVDNDGLHSSRERSGMISLAAGDHDLEVTFFERGGSASLSVEYEGPAVVRQDIPFAALGCTLDSDNDSIPNFLDLDSDNDGIYDVIEAGGTPSLANPGEADDVDGNPTNNNGIPDSAGSGLMPTDTLGDGSDDYLNVDSDLDGCPDALEGAGSFATTDLTGNDNLANSSAGVDADGVPTIAGSPQGTTPAVTDNTATSCNWTITGLVYNDTNGNGTQNGAETGVGSVSITITDSNGMMQSITTIADGTYSASVPPGSTTITVDVADTDLPANAIRTEGNNPRTVVVNSVASAMITPVGFTADTDNDNVADVTDNCPAIANPMQEDTDGDGQGDACDPDDDGDGIPDGADICPGFDDTLDADMDGVPNGCDSDIDNDGIVNAEELSSCVNQMSFEFYDGTPSGNTVDNIPTTGALATGVVTDFNVNTLQNSVDPGDTDTFGIRYRGLITITTAGNYTFYTRSDDGSKLFIGTNEVVSNDGLHGNRTRSGQITLQPGVYDLTVLFFENGGGASLQVQYEGPSIGRQNLPFSILNCLADTDADGVPNHFDLDSDNDGIYDVIEAGGTASTTNAGQAEDADGDSTNNNGIPSTAGSGTMPTDTGSDGSDDYLNVDSDGDGCADAVEGAFAFAPADLTTDNNLANTSADVDSNGVPTLTGSPQNTTAAVTDNSLDACFGTLSGLVYNDLNGNGSQDGAEPGIGMVTIVVTDVDGMDQTIQTNADGTYQATVPIGSTTITIDIVDADLPFNNVQTEGDNPTTVVVRSLSNTVSAPDGFSADTDNDRVVDFLDNCPTTINASQIDSDNDGVGDVCDLDDDNDGILDAAECPSAGVLSDGTVVSIIAQEGFESATPINTPAQTLANPSNNHESDFAFSTPPFFLIRSPDYVADINGSPWYRPFEENSFAVLQAQNNNPQSTSPTTFAGNDGLGIAVSAAEMATLGFQTGDLLYFQFRYSQGDNYLSSPSRPSDADSAIAVWFGNGTFAFGATAPAPNTTVIPGAWNPSGTLNDDAGIPRDVMASGTWQTFLTSFTYTGGDIYIALMAQTGAVLAPSTRETMFVDDVILAANPLRLNDADGDGVVNCLDLDSDNDGITDLVESGQLANGAVDANNDGIIDGTNTDFGANGLFSAIESDDTESATTTGPLTSDTDSLADYIDIDSDDDGIPDNIEAQSSLGYVPPLGMDSDMDGLDDQYDVDEAGSTPIAVPENTDGTDTPDYIDTDSDNDGINDVLENGDSDNTLAGTDSDNDGLDDAFDDTDDSATGIPTVNDGVGANNPVTLANIEGAFGDSDSDFNPGAGDLDYRDAPDNDNDGIADNVDLDDDNDGIPDSIENGGLDPLADPDMDGIPAYQETTPGNDLNGDGIVDSFDFDGDGIIDAFDLDSDNDGIPDVIEAGGTDPDNDGIIGTGVPVDADNDGLADSVDDVDSGSGIGEVQSGTPLTVPNTDGTGGADYVDIDSDDDGIPDNVEAQPTATYIAPSGLDTDNDGIDNAYDSDEAGGTPLTTPENTDGTDAPDYLDSDSDNDGIDDSSENGDTDNAPLGTDSDGDGLDDAFDDTDDTATATPTVNDGINPPNASNLGDEDGDATMGGDVDYRDAFEDLDGDGISDRVDADADNDGILDTTENNGLDPLADTDADGTQDYLDSDAPGFVDENGDGVDDRFDFDGDGIINSFDLDSDNDGITDLIEAGGTDTDGNGLVDNFTDADNDGLDDSIAASPLPVPNTDTSGNADYLDIDSDGDGIPDNIEGQATASYVAPLGTDTDADGIDDAYDSDIPGSTLLNTPVNTDGEDTPDYIDTDSDNDGILDIAENGNIINEASGVDSDGDGLDDAFDDIDDSATGVPTVFDDHNPPAADNLGDSDEDVDNGGDFDYRDTDIPDVRDSDEEIIVFNGFSPNGDTINDELIIDGLDEFPQNTLRIYNRWGVLVFDQAGYMQPGTRIFRGNSDARATVQSNKQLPVGTYFYVLEYVNASNEMINKAGYLYINR